MAFETLGERVKHAVVESGLSAEQIGARIGCSREAISQWINGPTKNIKNELLFAFCDVTGFRARWIATGEGPERGYEETAIEAIRRMVRVMEKLPAPYQELAVKLVEQLDVPPDGKEAA